MHSGDKNPIFYAGSGVGSTIGVYDRKVLQALVDSRTDPASTGFKFNNSKEAVHFLEATRQEIESAKLMECQIQYETSK